MINLIMSVDEENSLIETLHLDEKNGNIDILVTDIKNDRQLNKLQKLQSPASIMRDYTVQKEGVAYLNTEHKDLTFSSAAMSKIQEMSTLRLYRFLLDSGAFLWDQQTLSHAPLNSVKFAKNNMGMSVPMINRQTNTWTSKRICYIDGSMDFIMNEGMEFLLPEADLGQFAKYFEKLGEVDITEGERILTFQRLGMKDQDLMGFSVIPTEAITPKTLTALTILNDVYQTGIDMIDAKYPFEKTANSEPWGEKGKTDHGVKFRIDYPSLKFEMYMEMFYDENKAAKVLSTDPYAKVLHNMVGLVFEKDENVKDARELRKKITIDKSLVELLLYEIKLNLLYVYKAKCQQIMFKPVKTGYGSTNLKISKEVPGSWLPTNFYL